MKTALYLGAFVLFAVLISVVWVRECTGARPQVESVSLQAPASPDHAYVANVVVKNRNRNESEVTIIVRLISKQDGTTYFRRVSADLKGNQTLTVGVEVLAPAGDYDVEAEAIYPPR